MLSRFKQTKNVKSGFYKLLQVHSHVQWAVCPQPRDGEIKTYCWANEDNNPIKGSNIE